jgi:hypothetical protein
MAYLCPVCEEPQVDATHLADHMAFTAMLRGEGHEAWLDDHAPDWAASDDDALAATLRETVGAVDHPIDESAEDSGGHGHDHGHNPAVDRQSTRGMGALDEEATDILAEAREMTEQMQDGDGEDEPETK